MDTWHHGVKDGGAKLAGRKRPIRYGGSSSFSVAGVLSDSVKLLYICDANTVVAEPEWRYRSAEPQAAFAPGRQTFIDSGPRATGGRFEKRSRGQAGWVPPRRGSVVGDSHKCATHAKCTAANSFDDLSGRH